MASWAISSSLICWCRLDLIVLFSGPYSYIARHYCSVCLPIECCYWRYCYCCCSLSKGKSLAFEWLFAWWLWQLKRVPWWLWRSWLCRHCIWGCFASACCGAVGTSSRRALPARWCGWSSGRGCSVRARILKRIYLICCCQQLSSTLK